MILLVILAGFYAICAVGSYKLAIAAVGEDYEGKSLLRVISLFWPISLFYVYLKAALN